MTMNHRFAYSAALVLGLMPVAAIADDDAHQLAEKLVQLLRYDEQYAEYRGQCIVSQQGVTPEALVAKNSNYFGGILPGHAKWRRVKAAYESYFLEACERPTKHEFLATLASAYEKSMSVPQLKGALHFYSSSTGKALASAHNRATTSLYKTWNGINAENVTRASARFQAEISRISGAK